ncbi:MAG: formate dehydrogenase accessory sulfurtransferase FdhD [Vicinamibacterales bacterium]
MSKGTAGVAAGVREVTVVRRESAGAGDHASDHVAVEEPMEVRVNGAPFAVIMRTPGDDMALAAGFLLAEDVVRGLDEVGGIAWCRDVAPEARGNVLDVTVAGAAIERLTLRLGERRQVTTTSACGLCGRRTIASLQARAAAVAGRWTVPAAVVSRLPVALRAAQHAFEATGGVHAAALADLHGEVQHAAEDVGRHNAVDKLIGRALLDGRLPLDRTMLVVSGRTSYELVQKALLGGVPLVAAVSAPSSLAVDLARASGITLCGFVRGERLNVYSHPERLTDS